MGKESYIFIGIIVYSAYDFLLYLPRILLSAPLSVDPEIFIHL